MTESPEKILVVDDDPVVRTSLTRVLGQEGRTVEQAESGREALRKLVEGDYALVVLDLRMPHLGGLTVLQHLQNRHPDTVIVMMTGFPTLENAKESIRLGAFDYLLKPLDAAHVREVVSRALAARSWKLQRR